MDILLILRHFYLFICHLPLFCLFLWFALLFGPNKNMWIQSNSPTFFPLSEANITIQGLFIEMAQLQREVSVSLRGHKKTEARRTVVPTEKFKADKWACGIAGRAKKKENQRLISALHMRHEGRKPDVGVSHERTHRLTSPWVSSLQPGAQQNCQDLTSSINYTFFLGATWQTMKQPSSSSFLLTNTIVRHALVWWKNHSFPHIYTSSQQESIAKSENSEAIMKTLLTLLFFEGIFISYAFNSPIWIQAKSPGHTKSKWPKQHCYWVPGEEHLNKE